jgi:hypothetical protein
MGLGAAMASVVVVSVVDFAVSENRMFVLIYVQERSLLKIDI